MPAIPREALIAALPPLPNLDGLRGEIAEAVADPRRRVVVLDDDPTGVQTVHDVDVLTTWEVEELAAALRRPEPLFYVLTNSRALGRAGAVEVAREVAANLAEAVARTGIRPTLISRGDSTLRGHYPWELDPLDVLIPPEGPDGHLIVPAFPAGGRVTLDGVHYVAEGRLFVPAAETDFARDPTFGYRHASLAAWVEEKSGGRWSAHDVLHVPLVLLRGGDPEPVRAVLCRAQGNQPIVADCVEDADLIVLVAALLRAEEQGHRFLCRTAASFVKARAGLADRPLVGRAELSSSGGSTGGLVVVGSYVRRTAEQLERALRRPRVQARELSVAGLLDAPDSQAVVRELAGWVERTLAGGATALVYTSRELVAAHEGRDHVAVAAAVSAALAGLAAALPVRPAWVIAKGGITASDVATRGLGVRRARVLGQVATGVPAWRLGAEARFPGLAYIVFPGNVGTPDTLAELIEMLEEETRP